MSTFSAVSAVSPLATGRYSAEISPDWTIAGNPNGGYLLAVIGRAATAATPDHPHVLAASAHYLAAPKPGPVVVEVEVLRHGRNASQVRARLAQGAAACVETLLTVGNLDPETAAGWSSVPAPEVTPREGCVRVLPTTPDGVAATIMGHVDIRLDPAGLGFARGRPGGNNELRGWMSLPEDEPFDAMSLLYAIDALPPATLDLGSTGWVPTLELTGYVRALPAPGPLLVTQRAGIIDAGRVDETCLVWDSTGRLVAQATQLAGVRLR